MQDMDPTSLDIHREEERQQSPIDFQRMTAAEAASLIVTTGAVIDVAWAEARKTDDHGPRSREFDAANGVLKLINQEMTDLVARNPKKALDLYQQLMADPSSWPRELAAYNMSAPLLRQYLDDPEARQAIIDPWVALLDHDVNAVREAAESTISDTVLEGWIDEPTAHYLDGKLPSDVKQLGWVPGALEPSEEKENRQDRS